MSLYTIKKFKISSVMKVFAVIYAVLGFIGLIINVFSIVLSARRDGVILEPGSLVLSSIITFIGFFISGIIMIYIISAIYNLIVSKLNLGIVMEIEPKD